MDAEHCQSFVTYFDPEKLQKRYWEMFPIFGGFHLVMMSAVRIALLMGISPSLSCTQLNPLYTVKWHNGVIVAAQILQYHYFAPHGNRAGQIILFDRLSTGKLMKET